MHNAWVYPTLAIIGVIVTSAVWSRMNRDRGSAENHRLAFIYLWALLGAFVGAKLVYFISEGWIYVANADLTATDKLRVLLTGKTVTGALLGGYIAVEIAKKRFGHEKATGDFFAIIAPLGLIFGRGGCLVQGCCLGVTHNAAWYTIVDTQGLHRWPAVPVEILFNGVMFLFAIVAMRAKRFRGQLFHVYLIAYGLFRFGHEFLRDTPELLGPVSGYQLTALAIFMLGMGRYMQRASHNPILTGPATEQTQ